MPSWARFATGPRPAGRMRARPDAGLRPGAVPEVDPRAALPVSLLERGHQVPPADPYVEVVEPLEQLLAPGGDDCERDRLAAGCRDRRRPEVDFDRRPGRSLARQPCEQVVTEHDGEH